MKHDEKDQASIEASRPDEIPCPKCGEIKWAFKRVGGDKLDIVKFCNECGFEI